MPTPTQKTYLSLIAFLLFTNHAYGNEIQKPKASFVPAAAPIQTAIESGTGPNTGITMIEQEVELSIRANKKCCKCGNCCEGCCSCCTTRCWGKIGSCCCKTLIGCCKLLPEILGAAFGDDD